MRRMFSLKQLEDIVSEFLGESPKVVNTLKTTMNYLVDNNQINNVKPIYYHGIELIDYVKGNVAELSILNNDATAINSVEKFKAWRENIPEPLVIVKADGCVKINETVYHLYAIICSIESEQYVYKFGYLTNAGYSVLTVDLTDYFKSSDCLDGVNKIN